MGLSKLTLTADAKVVAAARRLAARRKTSISAMVDRFLRGATGEGRQRGRELGPITRQALGLGKLPKGKTAGDVLAEALVERHGGTR